MGTYSLLVALNTHWKRPVHPVYIIETRYGPPWRGFESAWARYSRGFGNALLIVVALALLTTVAHILTDQSIFFLISNALLQALVLLFGGLVTLLLIMLTWLWPIIVADAASGVIVRDREQRTLTALLTTPIPWADLLMIKLASTLRWYNRPMQMLFWVQTLLMTIGLIIAAGQMERLAGVGSPLLAILITALAGAQFAIGRIQDYAMACLLGVAVSIHSETRQTSSAFAILGGLSLVIGRIIWTGVLLTQYPVSSPQAATVLLATGPTTAIILISPTPVILMFLVGVPLIREIMIRVGYRWVLAHLGKTISGG